MLKLKLPYLGHLMQRADSLERLWCWERLKTGGEGDNRGWDGWMASLTQWTRVWVSSQRWWRTEKTGVLQSMGHRVWHDWATEQQLRDAQGRILAAITPRKAAIFISQLNFQELMEWDFPSGPVAKTLSSQCKGPGVRELDPTFHN